MIDDTLHIGLISLPIKKYSCVHFVTQRYASKQAPAIEKTKSQKAKDIYLSLYKKSLPHGTWIYDSELIQGKGMASSTADIVATIRCLDQLFDHQSSVEMIASILSQIERSDSVFLDTYVLYSSSKQRIIHTFNDRPQFYVCYIDEGDRIDTEQVGQALLSYYQEHLSTYSTHLNLALDAFSQCDLLNIARCSTLSAILAQGILPKKNFDHMLSQQNRYQADGIVVAHTGSLIGYLFIEKPTCTQMGELSSFFRGLGYACRFIQSGF